MNTITFKEKLPKNLATMYQTVDQFVRDYNVHSVDTYVEFGELSEDEVTPIMRKAIEHARTLPDSAFVSI